MQQDPLDPDYHWLSTRVEQRDDGFHVVGAINIGPLSEKLATHIADRVTDAYRAGKSFKVTQMREALDLPTGGHG